MGFEGVKINKLNGGLGGSNGTADNVFALLVGIALASLPVGVVHHQAYELTQPSDATALGIDAAYDANQAVLLRYAIEEFFRLAPDARLHLILAPVAAPSVMLASAGVKAALREADEVKGIGIISALEVAALAADLEAVQATVEAFRLEHRLIDFVICAGRGSVVPLAINAYPNLRDLAAPNVSMCIAQDPAIAELDAAYAKHAAIGAALGMLAVRTVGENLGSVNIERKPSAKRGNADYPLSDPGTGRWLAATLSDGTKVSGLSSIDKKNLTTKGYIFAGSFEGYDGVFFNSSPTAVELSSDYAYVERNRVWNKAARAIRTVLIPEVKGKVKKDPSTGYIESTTVSRWAGLINRVLEAMQAADEISGFSVYINPQQVLSESSPLMVQAQVVADDIVHEFEVDLGLTKQV